jgi:polyhydroxybutyrate depolymerase
MKLQFGCRSEITMRHRYTSRVASLTGVVLLLVSGCCSGLTKHSLVHAGLNRTYYVHEPVHPPATPTPLVLVLHGATDSACDAARMTRMNEKSDSAGFLVAYPEGTGAGLQRTWNATLCCDPARSDGVDDVGFIEKVIDDLASRFAIDSRRIYVAGFSNGAIMAHAVACALSNRIAAVGLVSGTGAVDPARCVPADILSVIAFHGDADERVKYGGGTFPTDVGGQTYPGIRAVVEFWEQHDGCTTALPPQPVGADAEVEKYTGGAHGTEVELYTLHGGNHSWPGGRRVSLLGQTPTTSLSATDTMWLFFEHHPKS